MMSPWSILGFVAAYFVILFGVAAWAGRGANANGYFVGNRRSPWWLLAFGLIGDTLSGVTFISVPGSVAASRFTYMPVVLGYVIGYLVISQVLLPLYYRLNLVSIYGYLGQRFDVVTHRTGSAFFLLSRALSSAARLYLAIAVFQEFVFKPIGVPFAATAGVVVVLIFVYTVRGGIQTLVWTDLLQSGFLLLALVVSVAAVVRGMNLGLRETMSLIGESPMASMWVSDWRSPVHGGKQFLGGALIALVMTGLDQNSMQRNLTCRTLGEAQRNIHVFIPVLVVVNALFLILGLLLHTYASRNGIAIPAKTDLLFPTLAWGHLGWMAAIGFTLGLTAATFNSADSVLTTLTTSLCVDHLRWEIRTDWDESRRIQVRQGIHAGFALVIFISILGFHWVGTGEVIGLVLKLATFTYGPLLGLFALGLCTRIPIAGWPVVAVCIASPLVCFWIDRTSPAWMGGYRLGNELLLLNGMLTAGGLVGASALARARRRS